MSMHKKALTDFELEGLQSHGLPTGSPSQCSDSFRNGMAWMQRRLDAALEREQALSAHVDHLEAKLAPNPWPHEEQPDGSVTPLSHEEVFGTPANSLARHDLVKQAEALEQFIQDKRQPMHQDGRPWLLRVQDAEERAAELRQRAANIQETGQ